MPPPGNTPPTQMRLTPDDLAQIDYIADALVAETGKGQNRTSVVRWLARREYARRVKKESGKKQAKSAESA